MTMSDESESNDSDAFEDKKGNFLAFTASMKSGGESYMSASPDLAKSTEDDDEDDLQAVDDKLYILNIQGLEN